MTPGARILGTPAWTASGSGIYTRQIAPGLDGSPIRKVANARPNLGDIGYVGCAQYKGAGTIIPQVATLPPRTVLIPYRRRF